MAEIVDIPIANLLFDEENPRLASPNQGQRETLRMLATNQGAKLRVLAQDILAHGLDPSELIVAMSVESSENRFVVLDGNRRLAALRALENPESVEGAIPKAVNTAFRRLSKEYPAAGLDSVRCVVVNDSEEARHWIELRHMGERGGAGSVLWGSEESARFRARTDPPEIHLQALDFLQNRGDITQDFRSKVAPTTYRRLLASPAVRSRLGLEWADQKLRVLSDEDSAAKALLYVADDIANGRINVGHVYTSEQRTEYANKLPQDLVAPQVHQPGHGVPLGGEPPPVTNSTGSKDRTTPSKPRDRLIPTDCVLNVTDPRLRDIERELRRLSLESYPNAVSVLLRVFLELGADSYIERVGLPISVDTRLGQKLLDVTKDLVGRKKLTAQQAKPVRRSAQKDSYLAPSVTVMHQYIHNQHMFPSPSDMRADWNNLQPWFTAIWSP